MACFTNVSFRTRTGFIRLGTLRVSHSAHHSYQALGSLASFNQVGNQLESPASSRSHLISLISTKRPDVVIASAGGASQAAQQEAA